MLIRSDFLFTAQNQILEDAAIETANDKIIAVGSSVDILKGRKPDYDFGNSLILPGLVNAHTHLDLSRFLNKIPSKLKFTEWLKQFIKIRPEIGYLTQKEYSQKIDEQIEYGITTIADINQSGEFINNTQARLILFLELLGFTPQMVSQKKEWFKENLQIKKSGITYGVSPHAPYSTTSELFDLAAQSGMMQMIHYKESNPEPDFSINGLNKILHKAIYVHGNYLTAQEIKKIKETDSSVAICPRCWDYYGHNQNLWKKLSDEGINVCLGTDSLASNYSLNLHEEMIYLYKNQYFSPETIIQMATVNGAKALRLDHLAGTLELGKEANLCVFQLPKNTNVENLYQNFFSSASKNILTVSQGQILFSKN